MCYSTIDFPRVLHDLEAFLRRCRHDSIEPTSLPLFDMWVTHVAVCKGLLAAMAQRKVKEKNYIAGYFSACVVYCAS